MRILTFDWLGLFECISEFNVHANSCCLLVILSWFYDHRFTISGKVLGAVGGESCSLKGAGPSGVKIELLSPSEGVISSVMTTSSGEYSFINVIPGIGALIFRIVQFRFWRMLRLTRANGWDCCTSLNLHLSISCYKVLEFDHAPDFSDSNLLHRTLPIMYLSKAGYVEK